ncbi:MAG: hypothetical protein JOY78_04645 [Pseudonocardia sp.]|nr:hypothetical protein [Pseudonocardia sp.]
MAARSARRTRGQRLRAHLGALAVGYAIGYVLFREKVGVVALVLIYAVIFGLWVLLLMPTQCDYITQRGGHCTRTVRGKLNGCASHARMKRDALFGAIGRRNPGTGFRVLWGDGTSQTGWRVASAMPPPPAGAGRSDRTDGGGAPSARYNRWMMGFTAISAVAAVVALLLPK